MRRLYPRQRNERNERRDGAQKNGDLQAVHAEGTERKAVLDPARLLLWEIQKATESAYF